MMNQPQIERMLSKLKQLEETLDPYIFEKQDELTVLKYETADTLSAVPVDDGCYHAVTKGQEWGGERMYCWFKSEYTVPKALANQPIYIYPRFGGYEALLFVDGVPYGNFAYKLSMVGHGNHYCDLLCLNPKPEQKLDIAIEGYAGHNFPGTQPFEVIEQRTLRYSYESIDICTKNQDIADFIYDLRTLNELARSMDKSSFRRADVVNCLARVHEIVYYSPEHTEKAVWRAALAAARDIMKPCLEAKNSDSAPKAALIGHSHMDTAWLWDISETIKKCARTYSNQLAFMDQYPEYKFVQSSAYHLELMRRHYPTLFEKLKARIAEGRYEPNGAVWVECDCNITGGESMVRQFLWGQRYTQKHFGYTSDAFWLPDTFGYSAAIPQIMKGSRVKYFLTTKMTWNDTTKFPYETFNWEGIDGSRAFVHLNCTHNWPTPETLIGRTEGQGQGNFIQQKTVADSRLISYGFGDGGGGPEFEMIEMARRCEDLEGCPKAQHTTVSAFMQKLESEAVNPNTYTGELYLELHRGTLTNQHTIKRNNRKAELAIRNAELLTCFNALADGAPASDSEIHPLLETLLVNQFHDILPGTCIQTAHEQSEREMAEVIEKARLLQNQLTEASGAGISLTNTLSFPYSDVVYLDIDDAWLERDDVVQQRFTDISGKSRLAIVGLTIPPFSSIAIPLGKDKPEPSKTPFCYDGSKLETPFAFISFNKKGYMSSFIDKSNGRELVAGYAFNTFLFAEDVPSAWDNWDIDADCQQKFQDSAELLSEEVVSNGAAQLRIRRKYRLSPLSSIIQDMVFHSHTRRVDFETVIEWHDKRRFLKTAFDTTILARQARHEIQFGNVQKPTTRNTQTEQAMFEVVNHKYTDISETQFGTAILNDCKYGISVEGSNMRLSLHKGGIRPDPRGDEGRHECVYSFLPHIGSFDTKTVIHPAYCLNNPPIISNGCYLLQAPFTLESSSVIVEAIKPCEDTQKAIILRLYEAEGTFAIATLNPSKAVTGVLETNLLEETINVFKTAGAISLQFKPFEIKTIKLCYSNSTLD